jgi:hypothetical protein
VRERRDDRQPHAGGVEIAVDTVIVYRVDERGKLVSLKAYWDFAKVAGELEAALRPR